MRKSTIHNLPVQQQYFVKKQKVIIQSYLPTILFYLLTKQIVRMGFEDLNLHRIFLTASSNNSGAIRAYEKAGFIHEGRMREAFYRNNEFSDKMFMGILKNEFKNN
jgi:RimJ/RimL family protein N-acetyltransferase